MSFKKAGELFLKTNQRNDKKASISEFRLKNKEASHQNIKKWKVTQDTVLYYTFPKFSASHL